MKWAYVEDINFCGIRFGDWGLFCQNRKNKFRKNLTFAKINALKVSRRACAHLWLGSSVRKKGRKNRKLNRTNKNAFQGLSNSVCFIDEYDKLHGEKSRKETLNKS